MTFIFSQAFTKVESIPAANTLVYTFALTTTLKFIGGFFAYLAATRNPFPKAMVLIVLGFISLQMLGLYEELEKTTKFQKKNWWA